MGTAIVILIWVLAAGLLLLLVALLSPLRIELRAQAGDGFSYSLALRPFGRLGPRLLVSDSRKPSPERAPEPRPAKPEPDRRWPRQPLRIAEAAFRLLKDIIGLLHIEKAMLDLRFGTNDPAATGQIYGALTPMVYGTWNCRRVDVRIEPVFEGAVFDGNAAVDLTITPARLLTPVIRFGWSAFGPRR